MNELSKINSTDTETESVESMLHYLLQSPGQTLKIQLPEKSPEAGQTEECCVSFEWVTPED